jgi:YHS domain-containing protein
MQESKEQPADPVCGMSVPLDSRHRARHRGREYLFCGEHCLEQFQRSPTSFARAAEPASPSASGEAGWTLGACAFLAIAALFLLAEHRAHLWGALPYLLVLSCPLIHLLMHRHHGGHTNVGAGGADR